MLTYHSFVDRRPVLLVHLVELVNEADASVGQDERAALERPLPRERVLVHARRESHGRRPLARRVHRAGRRGLGVLEHLRLGRAGVAEDEDWRE